MSKQPLKIGSCLYILLASRGAQWRDSEPCTNLVFVSEGKKHESPCPFVYIQIPGYYCQIRIFIKIVTTVAGPSADLGLPWALTLTDALSCFKNELGLMKRFKVNNIQDSFYQV